MAKSSDSLPNTSESGGMMMWGEGSSGFWFLARNSGRNLREKAPFLDNEITTMPERLEISEALLPEARATKKTVFKVRSLKSSRLLSLMAGDL